jgi:hypothetical protein
LGLVVQVDLDEHRLDHASGQGAFLQSLGQVQGVHRMDQGEAAHHEFRLVFLQPPDEVPPDVRLGQGLHLGQGLLHVVLAEKPLAARIHGRYGPGRLELGHGHQGHPGRIPPGSRAGPFYALPDP